MAASATAGRNEGPDRCPGPLVVPVAAGSALRLRGGRQTALVTRGRVGVNEPLACGAVQEADCGQTLLGRGRWGLRPLQRGAERRALGAVAHRGGAGFPHVLLRGRDIRHVVSP